MSKPAHTLRDGCLSVVIWRNTSTEGKTCYSATPQRSYKNGDDTWRETDSLNADDLLAMAKLLCSYGSSRSVELLAYYGDVRTAAAVIAATPALADDSVALENAAGQGHEAFVRLMLRHRPDPAARIAVGVRSDGPQAAVKSRGLTELLFAHGMDPSRPDWLGITPLHQFARQGDVENARIFLDHGADLVARDEDIRSTPLGWAAKWAGRRTRRRTPEAARRGIRVRS